MFRVAVSVALLSFCTQAIAYLSILESGEPVKPNELQVGFAPQFISGSNAGSNGVLNLRTGLDEGTDFSFQFGSGTTQFWTTLGTRWIPIPDFDSQPAIGMRFDVTLARTQNLNSGTIRVAPFISKRFRSDVGHVEPYAYLPIGLTVVDGQYDNMSNFVLGTQVQIEDLRPIFLYGETGFNIRNSLSYFTIGIFSTFER